ncbi:MAG TPA: cytosine permease [Nocardioidaceae bacterium]|nr:cytosine permease [Nocardioidaceae bacterium]
MTTTNPQSDGAAAYGNALRIERNGINVISEAERKGSPRDLFWPWCASNISVLGLSYAAFVLYFGLSFWQAFFASVIGTIVSFLLVGLVSLAGKRGSAPTMALSRASFGVHGNALPSVVSYLILVGWETVLVALATLATATVFDQLGWSSGDVTKVIAFLIVAALIVAAGVLGFDLIMRVQRWLTYITVVMTIVYIAFTVDEVDFGKVGDLPSGNWKAQVGALVLMMTAFGLSWVNSAADYSRYLPRSASNRGVVGWTTFGGAVAPVILVVYGLLLIGSRPDLIDPIASDPIGALATLLPDGFLLIYVVVAVAGLIAGAILDIYSSGLTLLTLGVPVPRWQAALLDGILMIIGAIYIVWIADDFLGPFMGFLITLGVPITSWCGIFLADLALRRRDYDDAALFDPNGKYGSVNWVSVVLMAASTVIGWGLVVNTAKGFKWEGYLLDPIGLGGKDGAWAFANLGVAFAFILSFAGYYLFCASRVRSQEASAPENALTSR